MVVKTRIVKIGNSRGIRIPKVLLDQVGLQEEVELEVQDDQLVIRRGLRPRQGWDQSFKLMAQQHEDQLLDEGVSSLTNWDASEWEW